MTKSALYGDVVFKPYFDMRKFESHIYNKEIIRENKIKSRKNRKIIDKVIKVIDLIALILFIAIATATIYEYGKIAALDYKILKLEKTLENKKVEYDRLNVPLSKIIKHDDLKMKAYLELNMVLPTDKNTIYFDKSDEGFVHQYENIH